MGAAAIDLLVQRVGDALRPPSKVVLPSELIIRESCGCSSRAEK
jgi:DNA-binding LacI/PurR family transcriptional regulator